MRMLLSLTWSVVLYVLGDAMTQRGCGWHLSCVAVAGICLVWLWLASVLLLSYHAVICPKGETSDEKRHLNKMIWGLPIETEEAD